MADAVTFDSPLIRRHGTYNRYMHLAELLSKNKELLAQPKNLSSDGSRRKD